MRVRGERECTACGSRWSYYETGSVTCPDCGSPQSVGVGDRAEHTDSPVELDLTPVRDRVEEAPLSTVADEAASIARSYCTERGFLRGGDLLDLTDTYLAGAELAAIGGDLSRGLRPDPATEAYFLELLAGADAGERPGPSAVPSAARAARGRAYAEAYEEYEGAIRQSVESDLEPPVRSVLDAVRTRRKRIQALEGDVAPAEVERLCRAFREVADYLRAGEEDALARARTRLD